MMLSYWSVERSCACDLAQWIRYYGCGVCDLVEKYGDLWSDGQCVGEKLLHDRGRKPTYGALRLTTNGHPKVAVEVTLFRVPA
jgi:hypothetical protein